MGNSRKQLVNSPHRGQRGASGGLCLLGPERQRRPARASEVRGDRLASVPSDGTVQVPRRESPLGSKPHSRAWIGVPLCRVQMSPGSPTQDFPAALVAKTEMDATFQKKRGTSSLMHHVAGTRCSFRHF